MDTINNARICAKRGTTAEWNSERLFVPMRGEIIIYMDHGHIQDRQGNTIYVPGVKIGDGSAYLIDLPFVNDDVAYGILEELRQHTGNQVVHITQSEREFWNNKLNVTVENGNLILNRQ